MHGVRLTWGDLPERVTGWVAHELGGPVVRARSQPGGFSPGTADRVTTARGRRAFVKAVSPAQNPDTPALHRREATVLDSLAGVDGVPRLLASYDDGRWVALLIEDVEGQHPLPWTHAGLTGALVTLGEVAARPAPTSWPALHEELDAEMRCWDTLLQAPPPDLDPWLLSHGPELRELAVATLPRMAGDRVTHTDVRADNLLVEADGTVRLVDWPWATRGAPWCDAAMLLLNVRWAGSLDVREHLGAVHALGATPEDVLGVLAGLTGFFTWSCTRPASPGLPTLRAFQREQAQAGTRLLRELWPT